jgi:glutaredoxin 2
MLGIEKLEEAQITSIKAKLEDIVDIKAREKSDSLLKEQSEKLIEEYEEKFEQYKSDVTGKFSNFVDSVLEEELTLPEKIVEFAKKGELYDEVISALKVKMAIDEGLLTEEVKTLLREARDEILSLRDQLNEATGAKMSLEEDAKKLAAHLYLRQKCDGLVESQRKRVLEILDDLTTKDEIDRKFQIVIDHVLKEDDIPATPAADPHDQRPDDTDKGDTPAPAGLPKGSEEPEAEAKTFQCICTKCGAQSSSKTACATTACPSCGGGMKDDESATPADESGQGQMEIDDPDGKPVQESLTPFDNEIQKYVKILKENRF